MPPPNPLPPGACPPHFHWEFGQCVQNPLPPGACLPGFHWEFGGCVPNPLPPGACPPNYYWDFGTCLPNAPAYGPCPPGFAWNEARTECVWVELLRPAAVPSPSQEMDRPVMPTPPVSCPRGFRWDPRSGQCLSIPTPSARARSAPSRPRALVVQAGESTTALARRAGVGVAALVAANPRLPTVRVRNQAVFAKLLPGQRLNVPATQRAGVHGLFDDDGPSIFDGPDDGSGLFCPEGYYRSTSGECLPVVAAGPDGNCPPGTHQVGYGPLRQCVPDDETAAPCIEGDICDGGNGTYNAACECIPNGCTVGADCGNGFGTYNELCECVPYASDPVYVDPGPPAGSDDPGPGGPPTNCPSPTVPWKDPTDGSWWCLAPCTGPNETMDLTTATCLCQSGYARATPDANCTKIGSGGGSGGNGGGGSYVPANAKLCPDGSQPLADGSCAGSAAQPTTEKAKTSYVPWLIGGGALAAGGAILYASSRKPPRRARR